MTPSPGTRWIRTPPTAWRPCRTARGHSGPAADPASPLAHPCIEAFAAALGAKAHVTVSEYLRESSGRTSRADRPCFPPSAHLNLAIDAGCTLRRVREPTLLDPADRTAHVPQFIVVLAVRG